MENKEKKECCGLCRNEGFYGGCSNPHCPICHTKAEKVMPQFICCPEYSKPIRIGTVHNCSPKAETPELEADKKLEKLLEEFDEAKAMVEPNGVPIINFTFARKLLAKAYYSGQASERKKLTESLEDLINEKSRVLHQVGIENAPILIEGNEILDILKQLTKE